VSKSVPQYIKESEAMMGFLKFCSQISVIKVSDVKRFISGDEITPLNQRKVEKDALQLCKKRQTSSKFIIPTMKNVHYRHCSY